MRGKTTLEAPKAPINAALQAESTNSYANLVVLGKIVAKFDHPEPQFRLFS
jgi:hypothetical protein